MRSFTTASLKRLRKAKREQSEFFYKNKRNNGGIPPLFLLFQPTAL